MNLSDLFAVAAQWRAESRPFAMAVVVETSGSTPRKPGARMLVPAVGDPLGTVGGGVVEHAAIDRARAMLIRGDEPRIERFDLGGELGSGGICGGQMAVFLETFPARLRVHVVGAGHVAEELVPMLLRLELSVVVHDPREDRLARPAFSGAQRRCGAFETLYERLEVGPEDMVLVMTPSHSHDYEVLRQLVELDLAYLGVLSSKRKRGELLGRLESEGVPQTQRDKVTMPLGLPIGSQTPAEIAVSIAAELVALRRAAR